MFISLLTNFATAVALMGTVPINLPLVRTAELQLSMSFSNLAVPAVGGMAAQIRFLQRQGVDLASAVASGGLLINVGNIVAQVILLVFAIALSPTTLHTGKIPTDSIVEVVLIALVVIAIGGRRDLRRPEGAQAGDAVDQERVGDDVGRGALAAAGRASCSAATRSTR